MVCVGRSVFINPLHCRPSQEQIILLIKGLGRIPKDRRIEFYEACVRSRRRDRVDWRGTELEVVFVHSDERKLMRLQEHALAVRRAVRERFPTLVDAFTAFDSDKDNWLGYRELQAAITGLGLGIGPDDVVELILQVCSSSIPYFLVVCDCEPMIVLNLRLPFCRTSIDRDNTLYECHPHRSDCRLTVTRTATWTTPSSRHASMTSPCPAEA